MKNFIARLFVCGFALCAVHIRAASPIVLLTDTYTANGNPNTLDLNFNLAGRQTGTLAPVTYTLNAGGNCQVGNTGEPHDGGNVLLCAFGSNGALDQNFNGNLSAGGLRIDFDLDPNSHTDHADTTDWGAVTLGSAQTDRNTFVVSGTPHFGILFRANGHIQAFDAGTVVSPTPEPNWALDGNYSGQLHHFELLLTDPTDGNPFDGIGQTRIEVFVDGSATAAYTFTKGGGGYANNYINFQDSYIGDFENLVIVQVDPPATAPVVITGQPRGRCVSEGQPFTLSVSANGLPAPTYQWRKNGTNISGAAGPSFTISPAAPGDAGGYDVIVSNTVNSVTSLVATIKVGLPLVNPSFEADTFSAFPGYVSGNGPITGWASLGNHGINPGTTFSPFADNGTIPDGQKVAFMQGDGPLSQTIPGFIVGDAYYVVYFENARGGGVPAIEVRIGNTTIVPAHSRGPVGGSNPYIEVISDVFTAANTDLQLSFIKSNPNGGDTTALIDNVCVIHIAAGTAPFFSKQPEPQTVEVNNPVTFTGTAVGSLPLFYQWRKNGLAITGATSSSFTLPSATKGDEGDYTLVVTNSAGAVTSVVARLTVFEPIPTLFNTGVDSNRVALADGLSDPHYVLIVNPDGVAPTNATVENSQAFPIVTGPWIANTASSKWIGPRFDTSPSAGGDYTYQFTFDLTNRDPATVVIEGQWSTDNNGINIRVNGVDTGNLNTGQFVVWTPFSINASNVAFGPGLNTIEFVVNNAGLGYTGLRVEFLRSNARILPNIPPEITVQPLDQTAVIGDDVTLSVTATGSDPLTYQWTRNNVSLTDKTNRTLTLPVVTECDSGEYRVTVANGAGMTSSVPVNLSVAFRRIPGIFGTGVNDSGALLTNGAIDPHYVLANSIDPSFPGPDAIVVTDGQFPIPPWVASGPKSKWIAPRADQGIGNAEGDYTFQTLIDLTTVDLSRFRIVGQWAVDNSGVDILVNNVSTGNTSPGFGSFTPFVLTNDFFAGINSLDFVMNNAPSGINPTGLRVDLQGLIDIRPVLSITRVDSTHVSVGWSPASMCHRLQSASDIRGPWTTVPSPTNPQTFDTTVQSARFFRIAP